MKIHRRPFLVLALALAGGNAWAQSPGPNSGPFPVTTGSQEPGFFAPETNPDPVVPPITPAPSVVAPIEPPAQPTVGASPSDRALRDSVVSAISADEGLQGASLNVSVSDGVVHLTGTARDQAQVDHARALVEGIAGPQ